jgi:type II secretory pathway component HofQ
MLGCALLGGMAKAADQPQNQVLPCGPGMPGCAPTKADIKKAHAAYERGVKLERGKQVDEAIDELEQASRLDPRSVKYLTAYELVKQEASLEHLHEAHKAAEKGDREEALADYRAALQYDPENSLAKEQLKLALGQWQPESPLKAEVVEASPVIEVVPNKVKADFHYTGDSKALLTQVAAAYGVTATIDDSVQSRRVRFDITNVDFATAMDAAGDVTKTFWSPLEAKQVLIAPNTPENHRLYDHLVMKTFRFPGLVGNAALNEISNVLRIVLEAKFVVPSVQTGTIVVRAPVNIVDAATKLFTNYGENRPQVMLDVNVYEVNTMLMRSYGLQLPNQFNVIYIGAVLAALQNVNINDIINQLISGGGINQLGNQSIGALIAQLTGQQSANSLFSQPLATFGSGAGLTGVTLGTLGATLSLNSSLVSTLEHATLLTAQGDTANLHIGTRYPIQNASFAPIFNTPAIAQNLINNTLTAPFPSISYEDLGLTIKAKPSINSSGLVILELEMQIRALGGTSLNGVPVITDREYKGSVGLLDGTQAVIAGSVSANDIRSLNGIPGLGQVPGLNHIAASNSMEHDEDQLLVVITPQVISTPDKASTELWLSN